MLVIITCLLCSFYTIFVTWWRPRLVQLTSRCNETVSSLQTWSQLINTEVTDTTFHFRLLLRTSTKTEFNIVLYYNQRHYRQQQSIFIYLFTVDRLCKDHGAPGSEQGGPPPEEGGNYKPGLLLQGPDSRSKSQSDQRPVQLRSPRQAHATSRIFFPSAKSDHDRPSQCIFNITLIEVCIGELKTYLYCKITCIYILLCCFKGVVNYKRHPDIVTG